MLVSMTTCDLGIGELGCYPGYRSAPTDLPFLSVLELTGGLSATALAFLVSLLLAEDATGI